MKSEKKKETDENVQKQKIEQENMGNWITKGLDTTEKVTEKCPSKSQGELDYVSTYKLAPVKNP